MAGDERWSNHYLYGCTAKAVAFVCCSQNAPFGCEAGAMMNFGLYLKVVVSGFGAAVRSIGQTGSPHRTLPQVHHRHEERIP
jgi:hypothetical protein